MEKMINTIQYYSWGSKDALTRLYGITNPDGRPMAELWMGAHPKSSSRIQDSQGNEISLNTLITLDPEGTLGQGIAKRFGKLPFLFKVLCADSPLSIQVHPNLNAAQKGFKKENRARIALDAPNRNYKDINHKPELIFALTPFQAMNGFRTLSSMVPLLEIVAKSHPTISTFLSHPEEKYLSKLFGDLMTMTGTQKSIAIEILSTILNHKDDEPWNTIRMIAKIYPDDSGLFSLLLLNLVTLQPGQAMFLFTQTPHAYLKGIALEVMASSDNVLRAGLTSKYVDIPELMANVKFVTKSEDALLTVPKQHEGVLFYPIPVDDFSFSLHLLKSTPCMLAQNSAAVLFCIDGEAFLSGNGQQCILQPGESVFISAKDTIVTVRGSGRLARVYNQINYHQL